MPITKPQSLKSLKTIALQPKEMTPCIEAILYMDLAGRSGNQIAEALGKSASRISIIRNSPLYKTRLEAERTRLREEFISSQAGKLTTGDPVEQRCRELAPSALETIDDLRNCDDNSYVRLAASKDILDRAGYKAFQEKTKTTIEVTEKMATRFERALSYEHSTNVRETTIRTSKEVS